MRIMIINPDRKEIIQIFMNEAKGKHEDKEKKYILKKK